MGDYYTQLGSKCYLNENVYEMYWAFRPLDNSRVCLGFFDVPQGGEGGEEGKRNTSGRN